MADPVERRIRQLNKNSRRLVGLASASGAVAGLLFIVLAVTLSEVVNRVFLGGRSLGDVLPLLGLMLLLIFGRSGFLWLEEILAQRAASLLKSDLRLRLIDHIVHLGPAYTAAERSGELTNAAVSGVETLDAYVAQYLPARYLAIIVPALVFVAILLLDPWSTLILLFAGPMLLLLLALIGGRTRAIAERRFAEMSWMSAFFLDMLQGLPTLKLYNRSREQSANILAISQRFGSTTMDVLRTAFQTSLVMEWAATAATAMVALETSLRLMNGSLPFNRALAILLLTPEFFLPLRHMALKFHAGAEGKAAAGRIFGVLDTRSQRDEVRSPGGRATGGQNRDIELRDVHLAYDQGKRPALTGLSLTVPAGKTVALVGPTGAGKSTVADLLLRFLQPDEGQIIVGGKPLSAIDPDAWRSRIAWVPQNPHLFYGSVADNLRLARPGVSTSEIISAAQAAHADRFIRALPQGYDTAIGEGGSRLSGGQRQRLAIARAYLKDAPYLILDEATANLDAASEQLVRDALAQLALGRTVLIIAHRLQLARDADLIAVIVDGRVVEQGRHQELLALGGRYQEMVLTYDGDVK